MFDIFSATVIINSKPAEVWKTLTTPDLMTVWMGEPGMKLEILTDWNVNSPITIRGFHHVNFENKGIVLQFEKERKLSYSHLSSVSRLPDRQENYSILEFILTPVDKQTSLMINISNFPTEIIRKHLEFYWRTTVLKIKQSVEKRTDAVNNIIN